MTGEQASNLEWEIDQMADKIKTLEYDYVTATKYSERKEILLDYRIAEEDLSILISQQDW